MKFSLIICTFKRPQAIYRLLESVGKQSLMPTEILVIDASADDLTLNLLGKNNFPALKYFKVEDNDRGLTRQRNFGISRSGKDIDIICFLDDDIILEPDYFEKLLETYSTYPDALGVGGYITNEVTWFVSERSPGYKEFKLDGYIRNLGSRNLIRKRLCLLSECPPGIMPLSSNGLSIGFLPPSGKIYQVEFFMGGVASYRKSLFEKIRFSDYFIGYGLYEDMDFCIRASMKGQLYVNTAARVAHWHEKAGRPNNYKYGRMVIRNGWYVWREKYPSPGLKAILKWHSTVFLLTLIRLGNVITTRQPMGALKESLGRISGWWSLLLKRPKHEV